MVLLTHSFLPLRFGDDAFLTACYLINRMPSHVRKDSAPIARPLNIQSDCSIICNYRYVCVGQVFVSITLGSLSFDPRCVSFRQHLNAQGYKCLDKTFGRIYISHDAIFDE